MTCILPIWGLTVFLPALCFAFSVMAQDGQTVSVLTRKQGISTAVEAAPCFNAPDRAKSQARSTERIKITVTDVEFRGGNPLSDTVQAQLVSDIQQLKLTVALSQADSGWLFEVENPVREAMGNLGYFRVGVTATPYLVLATPQERRYGVSVEIESGPQYRFGELQVSGATVFPADELRDQFLLHRGELFDVAKICQGLESIARLYGSKGYIDVTPEPDTTVVDQENGIIDVLIKVDEGGQYHVRTVETHGLDPKTERLLKSRFEPGQVFDSIAFMKFFDERKAAFPRGVSVNDAIHVRRDVEDASVDLTADFRPCPAS
jgi:outer membrane protein assembly factor BamA